MLKTKKNTVIASGIVTALTLLLIQSIGCAKISNEEIIAAPEIAESTPLTKATATKPPTTAPIPTQTDSPQTEPPTIETITTTAEIIAVTSVQIEPAVIRTQATRTPSSGLFANDDDESDVYRFLVEPCGKTNFEMLISSDGTIISYEELKKPRYYDLPDMEGIDEYGNRYKIENRLKYVWHPDFGWVKSSGSGYVIIMEVESDGRMYEGGWGSGDSGQAVEETRGFEENEDAIVINFDDFR
jgi:hypothetical protein